MKRTSLFLVFIFIVNLIFSQDQDSILINRIFGEALSSRIAYENLRYLCKNTKGRICGTPEAEMAVQYTRRVMEDMSSDRVYLQELKVKRWVRGDIEEAFVKSKHDGKHELTISGLGTSVGTGDKGITAKVLEVHSFDDLQKSGSEKIKGKIIFYNRAMDPSLFNTFMAYGQAVDQRTDGAGEAAKYGASGVIVRSLTTSPDDFPHTGVVYYKDNIPEIPAVCVSTLDADLLSDLLKKDPDLNLHLISNCKNLEEVISHNVIGELKGSVYPDQIITVGGHLDAWDTGEGAHDDGAGCIQSIEVLRLFQTLGIKPKRTIRAVMFMDEEIAQRGGKKYAEIAAQDKEKHYLAIESDGGGFLPLGFGFSANYERFKHFQELQKYFEPFGINQFIRGGGGVDIELLQQFGAVLVSPIVDMQRYFDYHHSPNDTFEQVNIRELQLGSAAIAALIYLIDKYDL